MLLGLAIRDALGNTTEGQLPSRRHREQGDIRDYLSSVEVSMQFPRQVDGRTTDVLAVGDGRSLHCEDKLAKGAFPPEQLASYEKEVGLASGTTAAIVIAPKDFLHIHALPDPTKGVWVEQLVDALEERIPMLERTRRRRQPSLHGATASERRHCVTCVPSWAPSSASCTWRFGRHTTSAQRS